MMYYPFNSALVAELAKPHVELGFAVEVITPGGDIIRVHTGVGEVVVGGEIYLGLGTLGSISQQKIDGGTSPKDLNLTLSLIDSQMMALALNERVVGGSVKIAICAFAEDGSVAAAATAYTGSITGVSAITGDENTVTYSCANEMNEWDKVCSWRYNDDSHQQRYPGDRFFRYTGQMAERTIAWGSRRDAPGFIYEG